MYEDDFLEAQYEDRNGYPEEDYDEEWERAHRHWDDEDDEEEYYYPSTPTRPSDGENFQVWEPASYDD